MTRHFLGSGLLLTILMTTAGCGGGGTANGAGSGGASGTGSGVGGSGVGGAATGMGGDSGVGGSAGSGLPVTGSGGSGTGTGLGGAGAGTGGTGTGVTGACGAGDANLPAEPTIPPACATLMATFAATPGTPPSEATLDTARIQAALTGCAAGQAVRLTVNGGNDGFITGPLTVPTGVTLWVDAGATLFGTRDPAVYGNSSALITVRGAGAGIVGDGTIDGQGGEPQIGGTQSWWDINGGGGSSPALIQFSANNVVLYRITLHNSPMFHVKVAARGFVAWGVTIKTPSVATNSVGTRLTPSVAHNTDGIDPGEAASNGFIVCSKISVGDDHIAIKGATGVSNLIIAHNHFGSGHGMSIGSEINGGVSNVNVYDLSIDGVGSGLGGGSSNGIRIKSDPSRGGLVSNITYSDICVRNLANPIILTPMYSALTGTLIPTYTGITIRNFRSMASTVVPKLTLIGYDATHLLGLTLDNVVVDGVTAANVTAAGTGVTVTNGVTGTSTPNPCTDKFVTL
jgi:polygalacturonase